MARIRWTPQSADDLDAIAEYIASDSPHYARLFVLKVISAIDRLERFPEIGRVVPEMNNPAVRELILGNYRIVYRLNTDVVEILTIYHGSRLLDSSMLN
ncbi:MAG: type II toxin-antitoxin system RelE/ParE family toxin [Pyrinomonadaceae bacterium]